jgi:hypothetical protein
MRNWQIWLIHYQCNENILRILKCHTFKVAVLWFTTPCCLMAFQRCNSAQGMHLTAITLASQLAETEISLDVRLQSMSWYVNLTKINVNIHSQKADFMEKGHLKLHGVFLYPRENRHIYIVITIRTIHIYIFPLMLIETGAFISQKPMLVFLVIAV